MDRIRKIKEIKRASGSSKKNLKFDYDASGNRISKQILNSSGVWENTTYYVRDGQGNVMSTYDERMIMSSLSYKLLEQDIYGSSRLGMTMPDKQMILADTTNEFAFDTLNKRQYELSNHLGNVLTVVYDRKMALDTNNDHLVDFHLADLASVIDYSAFGAPLANRGFSAANYRYGFNGKENDNEVKGNGNQQDYGMRIYDPRLGRFLSVDPLTKGYPWYTPYQFAGNKPIRYTDLDGAEENDSKGGQKNGNGAATTMAVDNTATVTPPLLLNANGAVTTTSQSPIVFMSAQQANQGYGRPPFAQDALVTQGKASATTPDNPYVRFSKPGSSEVNGRWAAKLSDVKDLTPAQIKDALDLDYIPTQMTTVNMDGLTVQQGAGNAPNLPGGRGPMQYKIVNGNISDTKFGPVIKLQNNATIEETVITSPTSTGISPAAPAAPARETSASEFKADEPLDKGFDDTDFIFDDL